MKDNNDKFLPNFVVFICYILITLSLIVILGNNTIRNLYTKNNIEHSINEVNIFQIPLESLIDSDLFGDSFELKDHNVYDLVLYTSKENKINASVIKDILSDTRLNKKAFKSLYSSLKENYFEENDTNEMIEKIIDEHEFKNSITIPPKLKSQLSTIMLNYVRLLSDMTLYGNEKTKENFFVCYSMIIAFLILTASILIISLVTKDKVLALKKVGLFGTIIAALMLSYSIIQELMFIAMQYKFSTYSYAVDGLGTVLFKSIFIHSLLLLFVGVILLLFAQDFISLDKDIKIKKDTKEKVKKEVKKKSTKKKAKKKKKKKKRKKKKINFKFPKIRFFGKKKSKKKKVKKIKSKKVKDKKEKPIKEKKVKLKKERKKIDFSKLKEKTKNFYQKINGNYLNFGSIMKKKNKEENNDTEKEQ